MGWSSFCERKGMFKINLMVTNIFDFLLV
uniref:Uncharacterized protein n=1 Tax=Nelumbo nucifera TaxID=4432 RepID=A0A822XZR6_NELNU|nr:TPA_asm: hypothetical protein HUJ06_026707 [Nelumbo nucifera]